MAHQDLGLGVRAFDAPHVFAAIQSELGDDGLFVNLRRWKVTRRGEGECYRVDCGSKLVDALQWTDLPSGDGRSTSYQIMVSEPGCW